MGNFCTQCGRPLQEGEVCNCTAQAAPNPAPAAPNPAPAAPNPAPAAPTPTPVAPNPVTPPPAAPTPAPAPAPTPVQAAPSQSSREIKQGFENLVTALKTVWKNPAEAASALAKKESWLAALILIAAQALFSGLFALTNYGVGLKHDSAISLVISFFFTFFFSIALSAAAMGMYLGIGKAAKAGITFKSALATASIRCFVCLPLTFIGLLLGMASVQIGMFFFFLGEIIAAFLSILAVEKNLEVNANRAFLIVGSTYVVLYILFVIFAALFNAVMPTEVFTFVEGSSYSGWSDWFN